MVFVQTVYSTPAEIEAAKKQRATDEQLKQMRQLQEIIYLKLQIWCRNGPSEALRSQISEAAEQYGAAFAKIMNSNSQPRITKR
jgi:hypothetical protein